MSSLLVFSIVALAQSYPSHLVPFGDRVPQSTLYRGFVVRTVEQLPVQQELQLTDDQKTYLNAFLKIVTERQQEATCALTDEKGDEQWKLLIAATDERLQGIHQELAEVLGESKWRRLNEMAMQLWGPSVLLYPHVAKALALTNRQHDEAKEILTWYEGETVSALVTDGHSKQRYFENLEEQRNLRLLKLLDNRQQTLWKTLCGEPTSVQLRPVQYPEFMLSQFHGRLRRVHAQRVILSKTFALIDLVRVPEVLKELELKPQHQLALERLIDQFNADETKRGGPIQTSKPRDFRDCERLLGEYAIAFSEIEKAIEELLPKEKLNRLQQIRLQLRGPMIMAGRNSLQGYGVTSEQAARLLACVEATMEEFRKTTASAPFDEYVRQANELPDRFNAAVWKLLTPAQRERWQQAIGKPLDKMFQMKLIQRITTHPRDVGRPPAEPYPPVRTKPMIPEFS